MAPLGPERGGGGLSAAVITAPGRVELLPVDPAEPAPGEVVIRVEGCGVCGSNLPVWQGRPWFEYPLAPGAPGHEGWGHVEALGDGAAGVQPGQRVAFLGDRAFAERAVVPADAVVPFTFPGPFPGEALACAFNAVQRADVRPGQTVAVVGIGFLGAVAVARAAQAGARVIAISRRPFPLDVARTMGAHEVLVMDEGVADRVRALTDGRLCDRVIEAVGLQEPLDLAGDIVTEGGTLVIAGFHQDGRRSIDLGAWNWRGIDIVNAHERDPRVVLAGIAAAADAIASGSFDPSPLYTHDLPLDRLGDALDALVARPDGFLKALVHT